MFSCSLLFSLSLIFALAASISHFLIAAIEFSCFSSNEIGLRCFFISRSSYFSVSHVNLDIKCSRKEDSMLLLLLFLSLSLSLKVQVAMGFTAETLGVLELQNFTPAYIKRCTYVRTILLQPKFLGCIDSQIFLPWCSATRASREKAPLVLSTDNCLFLYLIIGN